MTFYSYLKTKISKKPKKNSVYVDIRVGISHLPNLTAVVHAKDVKYGVPFKCLRVSEHSEWERDLTREGVEPNPGPSLVELHEYDAVFRYRSEHGVVNYNSIVNNLEEMIGFTGVPEPELTLQSLEVPVFTGSVPSFLQGESAYVAKLLEDLLILVRDLNRAISKSDYVMSIVTFTKLRSTKAFSQLLIEQWDRLMSSGLQSDDGSHFDSLRNLLTDYERIKNLPIFKKLFKFLMYCVGTSLFDKLGVPFCIKKFLKVEQAAMKKKLHMGPDFIHCILDTVLFLCETGYQCMITGSLDPIFHHETTYEKWVKDAELLQEQSVHVSNPEPHGFTVFDYLSRLDSTIEKGNAIAKFHSKDKYETKICKTLLNTLKSIRAVCLTKQLAQQERKAPFAVLVCGHTSVAKSTFSKMLFYHFGKLFDLPIETEYRFVRNPFDQFWVNFNSSQWCVQLDDIAFMHPNKALGCDPSLAEMLQVINNVPFVPTQADLADKGRTPLRARFVVATTNTPSLNANDYFACPLAVQRRFPFTIHLEPKSEYVKDGQMIDPTKLPESEAGDYPDFWRIVIKKVVPTSKVNTHMGQVGETIEVAVFEHITDFLVWFNEAARSSEVVQTKAMACDKNMSLAKLCPCGLPEKLCDEHKNQLQSDEVETYDSDWVRQVVERHAAEEMHEEPIERFFLSKMWEALVSMSLLTRLVVGWCIFIMWLAKTRFGGTIVRFFLGRWYFFWIASHMMHIPEMRWAAFYFMGYKAYRSVCRHKQLFTFCAGVASVFAVYKAFRFTIDLGASVLREKEPEVALQGLSSERGASPEPKGDKHENVWYKDVYECTPFDVNLSTLTKSAWSVDDLERLIAANCVHMNIRFRISDSLMKERRTKSVCVGGRVYMLNNHSAPVEQFELEIVMQAKKDGVTTNATYLITPSQYKRYPERDVMFIVLPVPPKRDIRNLFARESFEGRFDGEYFGRNGDGSVYRNPIRAPKLIKDFIVEDESLEVNIVTDMWHFSVDQPTQKGDCGAALLVKSNFGPVILGLHVLGSGDTSYALSVTYEFLESLNFPLMEGNQPNLQVGEYKQELGDLNRKSPLRWLESGTAQVFGSFKGFRGRMKSKVTKTFMSDLAVEHGYKRTTDKPMMNSWIPWHKALVDMTRPVTHIDVSVLQHCKESFTRDILQGLGQEDLAELVVYDDLTAINGMPGLAYVDKLNRSTSAGFPFKKSKKFFLEAIGQIGDLQHPVVVTPEIQAEMDRIIDTYENGAIYCPVFTASLKDEPTAIQKCLDGKTRVFCGAPMPWCIVVRKYMLSVIRVIQKNRFLFESGPGTIAQSTEWDDIYHHVTQFGTNRIVAGDYGKFDKRMPASVILAAFDIIKAMLVAAGWSARDLRVVAGIAEDTAFPMIDFHGDLIRCYGTNPSGHPLTVIINGLANSLYVRYCYVLSNPGLSCDGFKEDIALMTYGDDMIMGVNPQCHWLNHTVMRDTLASIDIEFTMADKTALSVPFINIEDATFLRRSWRFEPELGKFVCPIEHASIDKMLTMCVESKTVSLQFQAVEVMNTVVREYFWYGQEVFDAKRALMQEFVEALELHVYCERDFPSWDQLVHEYQGNSVLRSQRELVASRKKAPVDTSKSHWCVA